MGLFSLGNSLSAQTAERNKKILVAYFSPVLELLKKWRKPLLMNPAVNSIRLLRLRPILRQTSTGRTKRAAARWKWQTKSRVRLWVERLST